MTRQMNGRGGEKRGKKMEGGKDEEQQERMHREEKMDSEVIRSKGRREEMSG